jgi:hypothetical protein
MFVLYKYNTLYNKLVKRKFKGVIELSPQNNTFDKPVVIG